MSNINKNKIDKAYLDSMKIASTHYENFPVISFLVPRNLRKHVAVIYKFARQADDLADEGNLTPEIRLELLHKYEHDLSLSLNGKSNDSFWAALYSTICELNITPKYLFDLLKAFKQDVVKKNYENFEEVLNYCRHSANPVGRIILEIFGFRSKKINELSDYICTGLQITNFLQDTLIDFERGRIYIPNDELRKFHVSEYDFDSEEMKGNFKELIKFQVDRVEKMFDYGYEIINHLPGRLGIEIKWTILGGKKILGKIKRIDYNVINKRPKLSKIDYFSLLLRSLYR